MKSNKVDPNTTEKKKIKWGGKIAILGAAVLFLIVYLTVPAVKNGLDSLIAMFQTGNFAAMREFIAQYGTWAMVVSFLLMMFQSLAAPLPAFFITLTNANLFGWWQGAILSWSSAMAGAAMCFYIARILGRDVVEKICTKKALEQIDDFFTKYGKKSIMVARLLPFISFDIVSYAAGLTSMGFWGFFIATGVGQLPATIVYSYVGGMLTGGAKLMFTGLLCLFSLALLVTIIRSVWTNHQKKKIEEAKAKGIEIKAPEKFNWVSFLGKLYNSAFWGMIIAVLCGKSAFIAMRINMGWIFLGAWLLITLILTFIKKVNFNWKVTAINVVVSLVLLFIFIGMEGITTLPAAILREGIMMPRLPMGNVNIVMAAFIVIGFAAVMMLDMKKSKK